MSSIDIIFSSDNNYARHLGVVLCSIFENKNNNYSINVYIIDGGISNENKEILSTLETKYVFKIIYLYVKIEDYKDLYISDHITQAAYYRILIPELINIDIDKILYLDCDIVVLGDLIELFEINIDNYFAGVIEEKVVGIKENLGLKDETPYFNSGVILINLKKWREFNISNKTISFIRENPGKIKFWDQDALNVILAGKCLVLPKKFNLLTSEIENISNIKNPVIVHFSSNVKPWLFNGRNPFNNSYFYYLNMIPCNNKIFNSKIIRNTLIESNIFLRFIFRKIIPAEAIKHLKKILK
jgi:lipopolysaccharide biosynthesis glycosyltransferase